MILTGPEILRQHQLGNIQISPFDPKQINPNSYNFKLGDQIMYYVNETLDPRVQQDTVCESIPESGFVLLPSRIYLGHTYERMGSDYFVPIIRGRSSTARMGLFVHVTADLIDIGSLNQWTLQVHAVQPIRVFKHMVIGQVTFWTVQGTILLYSGKYQGASGPRPSEIYKEFSEGRSEESNDFDR